MKYFSEIYGLITKHDPITENGGLFFSHYLVLKRIKKINFINEDYHLFISKMGRAQVDRGLFKRSANHNERTVSHDEISGMIITSCLMQTNHRYGIMTYLRNHLGFYPATGALKFYSPADYYAWLTMSDSIFAGFFFVFYLINLLISSNKAKQETSSKLIYLSELHTMRNISFGSGLLWRYFSWRMKKMYGALWVERLFEIYFSSEDSDHPLIELSKGVML